MKRTISTIVVALMIISFTSCATTKKIAWKPEVIQSIKRIAIIETPEPDQYLVHPGQAPGNVALLMFGAIGGAIAGGIEANRQKAATKKLTEAITPLKPELAETMLTVLEKRLMEKGYDVQRVSPPPMAPDSKNYDFSKIEGAFDAVLVSKLTGGYCELSGKVSPKVSVSVSIVSPTGTDTLFADSYLYCTKQFDKAIQVLPDQKYVVKSIDALYEDLNVVVDGLRTGTEKISERATADL